MQVTLAVLGCGARGRNTYGTCLLSMGARARVNAIAELRDDRRDAMAMEHQVQPDLVFTDAEDLLRRERLADAVLICTQDRQHVGMAVQAMKKGYHVLLEKPVSGSLEEIRRLLEVKDKTGRHVVVCHVLRYTPFFRTLHGLLREGRIGEILSIQAVENVGYWHMTHSFVRGNWRSTGETSPMILQKCCHDLDYLVWLTGKRVRSVSSQGSLSYFRPEKAPEGATMRCMDGCKVRESCPYDCEKIYLDHPRVGFRSGHTGWPLDVVALCPTEESLTRALMEGPYGRCVFHCDNDVADHQTVQMEMEGGCAALLNMACTTSRQGRELIICGTLGDIRADTESNQIRVGVFGREPEIIDVNRLASDFSGHGGGDRRLLEAFLDLMEGKGTDPALTTLEESLESHLAALAAEKSRLDGGRKIDLEEMRHTGGGA